MHGENGAAAGVIFGWDPLWIAAGLFVATYAVVVSERINRAIVALLGAGLMILSGVLTQQAAVRGVDFNTLGLLVGMMVIVAITRQSGVFQFVAIWSAKKVQAEPLGILLMLALFTALFSALLDNVTTVLLIVPVTLLITEELKVRPYPFLFTEIVASNIGGTATLIGDPPNIMIGSAANLSFNDFVFNLMPIALLIFGLTMIPIVLVWRKDLVASDRDRLRVMAFKEREAITDSRLLKQSLAVLALVTAGFVMAHPLRLEPATIALFGAALLLLLHNFPHKAEEQAKHVHHSFAEVEWVTIFFFVGLFIVVYGIEQAGLIGLATRQMLSMTGGDIRILSMAILWGSAVFSALVDNIPFVATMIPLIKSMAPALGGEQALIPLWWSLALGACLGGNGSLIGASANLVVAGFAERAGHPIRFTTFLLHAAPLMLGSIAISSAYIWFRYL
ncbi:MAG: ArsB/NhaD family transporter [Sulfuricellaceae bacterium]|nr:ArsB/NhaD family transporter [Sulfuricellaceae bacterium]